MDNRLAEERSFLHSRSAAKILDAVHRAIVDDDGVWAYDDVNEVDLMDDAEEHIMNTYSKEDVQSSEYVECEPMTIQELKDYLMDGGSIMAILDFGYTAEDFKDPEMKALWVDLMEQYVKLGEGIDKVEAFLGSK